MKFIALFSILFTTAVLASIPHSVCLEEFKRTGDQVAFDFCTSQDSGPAVASIPRHLCDEMEDPEGCRNGDYDNPVVASLPMNLCLEVCETYLDNPEKFEWCRLNLCNQGDIQYNFIDNCEKYAGLPENQKPVKCQEDEFGPFF